MLEDFGIPLHLSSTVTRLRARRVSRPWVSQVDPATRRPFPGTETRVACDTLLLSVGLLPENEVAGARAGARPCYGGPVVDDRLSTSVPGVFSCGNALHVHDLADFAAQEGVRRASAAAFARAFSEAGVAAVRMRGLAVTRSASSPSTRGENVRYVVPQRMVLAEPFGALGSRWSFRVSRTISRPRFIVEAIDADGEAREVSSRSAMVAVPAEMRQMRVDRTDIADCRALRVRVEERGIGHVRRGEGHHVHQVPARVLAEGLCRDGAETARCGGRGQPMRSRGSLRSRRGGSVPCARSRRACAPGALEPGSLRKTIAR